MSAEEPTKIAVCVAEMARMVGLSRARFYQLQQSGVFPKPERDAETGRPFYSKDQQRVCLEVRRRNCGVNGRLVLFYARRMPLAPAPSRHRKTPAPKKQEQHADLIDSLQALGLAAATAAHVTAAVKELYPQGTSGVDEAEIIRAVFLHLRRKE